VPSCHDGHGDGRGCWSPFCPLVDQVGMEAQKGLLPIQEATRPPMNDAQWPDASPSADVSVHSGYRRGVDGASTMDACLQVVRREEWFGASRETRRGSRERGQNNRRLREGTDNNKYHRDSRLVTYRSHPSTSRRQLTMVLQPLSVLLWPTNHRHTSTASPLALGESGESTRAIHAIGEQGANQFAARAVGRDNTRSRIPSVENTK